MTKVEVGKEYKSHTADQVYNCLFVGEKGAVFKYGLQEFYLTNTQIYERKLKEYILPVIHSRWVVWWKNNDGVVNCSLSTKHPSVERWIYPIIHSQEVTYEVPKGNT